MAERYGSKPVSYTHLDVYKRQQLYKVYIKFFAFFAHIFGPDAGLYFSDMCFPVSYTHLDVYKRQGMEIPPTG